MEEASRVRQGMGIAGRQGVASGRPRERRVCRLRACRRFGWQTDTEGYLRASGSARSGPYRPLRALRRPVREETRRGLWSESPSSIRLLALFVLMLGRCGTEVCYSQLEDGGRWMKQELIPFQTQSLLNPCECVSLWPMDLSFVLRRFMQLAAIRRGQSKRGLALSSTTGLGLPRSKRMNDMLIDSSLICLVAARIR